MDPASLPHPLLCFPATFARRAQLTPTRTALGIVSFTRGSPASEPFSCARLENMTWRAAAVLVERGLTRGSRVLLSLAGPADFFAFFLGAQCIGAVPVPLPSTAEIPTAACVERICSVAQDAEADALIVDDDRACQALPDELKRSIAVFNLANAALFEHDEARPPDGFSPERALEETAFLQYTSGTTSAPKGVVVRHGNLIANIRAIVEGGGVDHRDVAFSWLPTFHDMGLVAGLLLGMYVGIPTYVAASKIFVLRPETWVRAISHFRATFSAGPNFAFDVLARRVPDRALEGIDLSCWRLAFDGAEFVDSATVRAFTERYATRGFRAGALRPAYGLAEATLAAAFVRPGEPVRFDCVDRTALATRGVAIPVDGESERAVTFVGVGSVISGHRISVVDPASQAEVPPRHLGEIVVSGPSVSPGYFRELSGGVEERAALRTGDLGYIADGELYVVDRIKDLLIVAGRKYAPSDIERVVGDVDGVRAGAVVAFSERASGTELVCVLAAQEPGCSHEKRVIHVAIRRALHDHFGLGARVFLVRRGQLPRTSSGKLRRAECRRLLASGRLDAFELGTA
jgi:acyl-CoA synthetase (AMP-forming)/AMP-acid ligase II